MITNKDEAKQQWRGRPVEVRLRYMARELMVPHPSFTRVLREIQRLSLRCRNEERGLAVLVLAGSGAGKTFMANTLQMQFPADHSGETSNVPVVVFSIPSAATEKALSSSLLRALHDPKPNSGSAGDILARGISQMAKAGTRIICIDNVQDIPERRRSGGVMQLGNWVRDLIDKSKCVVVLMGTPAAKLVVEGNAQLRRRGAKRLNMNYFSLDTKESKARFMRFMHELDQRLPLAEESGLSELPTLEKLYYATFGVMDYIIQLLSEAVSHAFNAGREKISEVDLEAAFESLFQDSATGKNPFSKNGPCRILDQDGEPFHNWFDGSNPRPDQAK